MSSSYRLELDRWLSQLDVKANRVLDIGGSQLPVKGRTKSWDVKEYLIADLPEPHVDSPQPDFVVDMNLDPEENEENTWEVVDNEPGEMPPFKTITMTYENMFDLVFCLEVFDYVWHAPNGFENIWHALKPGGTAWVTFPSVYPLHQPVEDDALRYMPGGIQKLADVTGLTIKQMIPRRTETDAIYRAFKTERMRCAKNEDHNISGWICEFTK